MNIIEKNSRVHISYGSKYVPNDAGIRKHNWLGSLFRSVITHKEGNKTTYLNQMSCIKWIKAHGGDTKGLSRFSTDESIKIAMEQVFKNEPRPQLTPFAIQAIDPSSKDASITSLTQKKETAKSELTVLTPENEAVGSLKTYEDDLGGKIHLPNSELQSNNPIIDNGITEIAATASNVQITDNSTKTEIPQILDTACLTQAVVEKALHDGSRGVARVKTIVNAQVTGSLAAEILSKGWDAPVTTLSKEVQENWFLLHKVRQIFLNSDSLLSAQAVEIANYLKEKKDLLLQNQYTALPAYFHATGKRYDTVNDDAYSNIVSSKVIHTSRAAMGEGVYVSTNDESDIFGPHTFALDARQVHLIKGAYYQGGSKFDSLWVRLSSDIALTPATLAHIVVEETELNNAQEKMRRVNLKVPAITRAANIQLTELFSQAREKLQLPHHWVWMESPIYGYDPKLPANVVQDPKETRKKPWIQSPMD